MLLEVDIASFSGKKDLSIDLENYIDSKLTVNDGKLTKLCLNYCYVCQVGFRLELYWSFPIIERLRLHPFPRRVLDSQFWGYILCLIHSLRLHLNFSLDVVNRVDLHGLPELCIVEREGFDLIIRVDTCRGRNGLVLHVGYVSAWFYISVWQSLYLYLFDNIFTTKSLC